MSRPVFRLRFQTPEREPNEPEVGYAGGDIVRGDNDELEYGPTVTRYYFSKGSLSRKLKELETHGRRWNIEEAPARIVSIDVADLSDFRPPETA